MNLTLKIWRQKSPHDPGRFETVPAPDISPAMSFLEMLDLVNERLIKEGREPFAFDHDCREGICGMCGIVINGRPHGHEVGTTVCQLHMRSFRDGGMITIEPFRAKAFPAVRDLVVDRSALDRIIQAGGYISVRTGGAPDAHALPIPKEDAEKAMDASSCIGCGACVASCPNASAMLFTAAKVSQLALLPQGRVEARRRALNMVRAMDRAGFGNCSNIAECEAECPKEITLTNIARLNRHYLWAALAGAE